MFRFLGLVSARTMRVLLSPQGLLMLFSIALAAIAATRSRRSV